MSTLMIPSGLFSARDDATQLNRAFKGIGCDAGIIINILAHRTASQRDDIQQEYETTYSYDLKKQLSSELHGHLKKAIMLWMQNPMDRDVSILRQALSGPMVEHKTATQILCSRSSSHIRQLKQAYASAYDTRLQADIEAHTSGNHKQLLLAYTSTTRYEGPEIDKIQVENDAKAIGVHKKFEMDELGLVQIFSDRSRSHLVALQSSYHKMYGTDLKRALKKGTSGSFRYALLTILQCADNPAKYFATVLRKSMKGIGTKDTTLIRVVVTRAEVDMQRIKQEYRKLYKKSLTEAIHSETSGSYRSFLLALLGANDNNIN
ncbi:annexin 5 [Euphorbia peplus]|nr:annexin 5 [Euphorbia peplus]